jgi:hypothetical protein
MPLETVITPASWPEQQPHLQHTQTGLLNLVGWFGSTHTSARWRKAPKFLEVFCSTGIPGFDPQINGWDPSYATVEAEVMATASVVIIRLENHELINGSLGSIAEVGLAVTSAALRGQIIIVSIENNILASLTEPGAIAQYMLLELHLEQIEQTKQLSPYIRVHRGDDLQHLASLACNAAQQRWQAGQIGLDYDHFLAERARRRQNYPLRVVLGGSGGPYAQVHQAQFERKKKQLVWNYVEAGARLKILSEGATGRAWAIPYGGTESVSIGLAMQTLLSIELEYKQEADTLLLPIMAESASKAAATEIGFLLLHALVSGQEVKIFLEPFEPIDFIRHQLKTLELLPDATEKSMRQSLYQAGIPTEVLAIATQTEVTDTFALIKALVAGILPSYKQIKQSLLGQTETFHNADNIRRVRALVEAHLERLHTDPKYPNFFAYTNQISADQ